MHTTTTTATKNPSALRGQKLVASGAVHVRAHCTLEQDCDIVNAIAAGLVQNHPRLGLLLTDATPTA